MKNKKGLYIREKKSSDHTKAGLERQEVGRRSPWQLRLEKGARGEEGEKGPATQLSPLPPCQELPPLPPHTPVTLPSLARVTFQLPRNTGLNNLKPHRPRHRPLLPTILRIRGWGGRDGESRAARPARWSAAAGTPHRNLLPALTRLAEGRDWKILAILLRLPVHLGTDPLDLIPVFRNLSIPAVPRHGCNSSVTSLFTAG